LSSSNAKAPLETASANLQGLTAVVARCSMLYRPPEPEGFCGGGDAVR